MEILPEIDWDRLDTPFRYEGLVLQYAPEAHYEGGPPRWWRIIEDDGRPSPDVVTFEGNGFALRHCAEPVGGGGADVG